VAALPWADRQADCRQHGLFAVLDWPDRAALQRSGSGWHAQPATHHVLAPSAHSLDGTAGGAAAGHCWTRSRPQQTLDGAGCGHLDLSTTGPSSARPTRVGLLAASQAQPTIAAVPACPGQSGGAGCLQKNVRPLLRQVATAFPQAKVEVWAMDEHRIGLKPLLRRIWAPIGQRPVAHVHQRFAWRYLVAYAHPASCRTVWQLATSVWDAPL